MDAAESAPKRDNTTPSCAVCQRRKVKCNRTYPCAPCTKTGLECSFKPVSRHPQKRVKRANLSQVVDREDDGSPDQKNSSATLSAASRQRDADAASPETTKAPNTARLVSEGGGYRYVNNHLWSSLPVQTNKSQAASPVIDANGLTSSTIHSQTRTDIARSDQGVYDSVVPQGYDGAVQAPTTRSFLFQQAPSAKPITQPTGTQVVQLWQAYLSNVDPMMKVFHAPTVQQLVLAQVGGAALTTSEQALISAIYFVSIVSLNEVECRTALQEPRDISLQNFRLAVEEALASAAFVTTTDLVVLQALVLYLAALRSLGDTQTVWSLTGLAIRIAGTIGLARDGDILQLPPFESEMRRRLWWAIVYLDARTAELVGQDGDLLVSKYDVKPPSNLNDSEMSPRMSRLPEARTCSGEVVYVQLRATLALCLRKMPKLKGPGGTWQQMAGVDMSIRDKMSTVEGLEKQFREEILDHCDPAVPLQLFTMNSASTFLNKMRLVAQIPETQGDSHGGALEGFSEHTYKLSMRLMQLQLEVFTEPCLQRWRWHWQGQFQWYALACLIRQTRLRAPGLETTRAWAMIRKVFDVIIPGIALGPTKSPILEAIRTLLASGTQEQAPPPAQTIATPARTPDPNPIAISNITSPVSPDPIPSFKAVYGSQPHSALLPSVEQVYGNAPATAVALPEGRSTNGVGFEDPTLGIDFAAIDWVEFDRLTTELCAQER